MGNKNILYNLLLKSTYACMHLISAHHTITEAFLQTQVRGMAIPLSKGATLDKEKM